MTFARDTEAGETFDAFRMYVREIARHDILSRDEEAQITGKITLGDRQAEQRLITANLRLVVKIALQYSHFQPNLLDLVQEGNMGLVRAVKKYDPAKGTRFSTYASFWIRAFILKYLMDDRSLVKMGTKDSQRKIFFGLAKMKEKLEKGGLEASPSLIAEGLGVDQADVEEMEQRLYNSDVSLDEPLTSEGDSLMDTLSSGEDVEEEVADYQERELVGQWLGDFKARLSDKERYILENRIMSEEPLTLRDIGDRFHVSRESVRQMQTRISRTLVGTLRSRAEGRPVAQAR
jgi:RNA polymerase sigma-32 factor